MTDEQNVQEKTPEQIAEEQAMLDAGKPPEKAPETPAAEVITAAEASQAALQAAANEDDTLSPEVAVEHGHTHVHNPNALRGVRAGPLPHPRQA